MDYIGFHETKKDSFSKSYLKSLLGNRDFARSYLPAIGSAGGILVGINCELFEIMSCDIKSSQLVQ